MKKLFFVCLLCWTFSCSSQEKGQWSNPNAYQPVKVTGGLDSLMKSTERERKLLSKECELEGSVFVQYLVSEKGDVKEYSILKGLCSVADSTALAISKQLKFKPAIKEKKPFESKFVISFPFSH